MPFAPDGGNAAECDMPMLVLDARKLDTLREVRWTGSPAPALALSADGSRFAACGTDGILRIHNADAG